MCKGKEKFMPIRENAKALKEVQAIKITNWHNALKEAALDPAVNIRIAPLAGDSGILVGITELNPGTKITAHVHYKGIEVYHILKGNGEIYTGIPEDKGISWNPPVKVKDGDVFAINPGMIHQLKNTSQNHNLILIFICPPDHLKQDRFLVEDYG